MAWVQSKGGQGSATTLTVTFTSSNVLAGNTLVAYVSQDHNTSFTPTSVKDGAGNAFIQIGTTVNYPSTTGGLSVWSLNVPAGDVGTKPAIKATFSATFGNCMLIQEVSGIATASTSAGFLDGTQGHNTGTTTTATSGAYSDSQTGEFLVGLYGDPGTTTSIAVVSGTGWTADTNNVAANTNADLVVGYKNSSAGGAESFSWTTGASNDWGTCLFAFKPSASTTFIAPCATVVGQGEGMTPSANTGVASAPTIYQAGRRASFY